VGELLPALASFLAVMLKNIAGITGYITACFCGSWRGRGDVRGGIAK